MKKILFFTMSFLLLSCSEESFNTLKPQNFVPNIETEQQDFTEDGTDTGDETDNGGTEAGGTEAGGTEDGGTEDGGTEDGGTEDGGTGGGGTEGGGTGGGGTEGGATGCVGTGCDDATTTTVVTYTQLRDEFVQNSAIQESVDILFVVDDSMSMKENQNNLKENFNTILDPLIEQNIDFRMMVINTDPRENRAGKLLTLDDYYSDDKLYIDLSDVTENPEDAKAAIKQRLLVGLDGSGLESGVYCTLKAFELNSENSTFRPGVRKIIVSITDEIDNSTHAHIIDEERDVDYPSRQPSELTTQEFLTRWKELTSSEITFINIANTSDIGKWESRNTLGEEMARLTNGIEILEITDDFSETLSGISNKIIDLKNSFTLSQTPFISGQYPLEVIVGGQIADSTHFLYDAENNTIKFEEAFLPYEEAIIEVNFYKKETVVVVEE